MFTLRYRKSRDNLSSSDVTLSSRMPMSIYQVSFYMANSLTVEEKQIRVDSPMIGWERRGRGG